MNKILIALVLAFMISGNVFAEKYLEYDGNLEKPTYEECKKALLNGGILHKGTSGDGANIFSIYYRQHLYHIIMEAEARNRTVNNFYCHKFDNDE
jgi:hypothetical protein